MYNVLLNRQTVKMPHVFVSWMDGQIDIAPEIKVGMQFFYGLRLFCKFI